MLLLFFLFPYRLSCSFFNTNYDIYIYIFVVTNLQQSQLKRTGVILLM